jgi:transcriptional repressor of cell division inhibition gene dicB
MKMTTREAVRRFGSKRKLAKALGISPQAVSCWGRFVPPLRVYQIEALTPVDYVRQTV